MSLKEYEELTLKEKLLNEKLKKWNGDLEKKEMDLLHTYNEVKDAAQIVLAAIAEYEGVTVKKIHERFDLPLSD